VCHRSETLGNGRRRCETSGYDGGFRAASAVEKSMRYSLLLSQLLPAPGMRVLATRADVAVAILSAPTEEALALAIADADGVLLVLERPRLTAEMVRAAPRLRVVCRCGAGYDNIDVTALTAGSRSRPRARQTPTRSQSTHSISCSLSRNAGRFSTAR